MKYKLRVSPETRSFIRNLHPEIKKKIKYGLNEIVGDPDLGKFLKKELKGLQSYKISRYRIIYRKASDIIELIAVGPRKNIYEETVKLIKKQGGEL